MIDSIDEAIEQDWLPCFYEGDREYGPACASCSEKFICVGKDGEMEVNVEYRVKIVY